MRVTTAWRAGSATLPLTVEKSSHPSFFAVSSAANCFVVLGSFVAALAAPAAIAATKSAITTTTIGRAARTGDSDDMGRDARDSHRSGARVVFSSGGPH